MKFFNKYILASAAAITACSGAFAQASYSGYFLDNYTHRYQLNPAMADDKGFVTFPALGNMNLGMHGNTHVTSFLYNYDGRTVLFTNPNIPASTVLSNIHDKNRLGLGIDLDILGVGFKAFGGMNAVTISADVNADIMLPGSIFRLAKEGIENKTYDISNIRANANATARVQLNHSRDIKQVPGLRVGAAVKFIVGLGSVDAYFKDAHLQLGEDSWNIRSNAEIYANIKGASFSTTQKTINGVTNQYVDGINMDGFGPNGFGLGFDLGATYQWRDFEFSLSLLDLGFMSWGNTLYATTDGVHEVKSNDYIFGLGDGEADATWDKLKDDFSALYELQDKGNTGGRTEALNATLNWGVRYTLPYYRNLTFGLVNTTFFHGTMTYTDFRLSANVRPVKCFSASANLAMGTYGIGFGWLANVNIKGFNFFIGMDRTLGKLAKQGVPLNSNAEVNLGINFPF